ncbi:MAG: TIGR04255 family protein [bacterium]|nr:TIGR04255 family protein [bacterium]
MTLCEHVNACAQFVQRKDSALALSELPDFERPPVIEVALSVQFEESLDIQASGEDVLAAAWPDYDLEMRPVLTTMGLEPGAYDRPDDEAGDRRLWLSNPGGSRVIQVQHDRLAVHWTQEDSEEIYPRFASLREFFVEAWHRLNDAVDDQLVPGICQVLYVNHIGAESGWQGPEDTPEILAPWGGIMSDDFLPEPGIAATYLHFHIPDPGEWLDIQAGPVGVDDRSVLAVYLAARGIAASPDLEGVLEFMDLAHEWIVRGFASFTTPSAHKTWGRNR